MACKKCNSEVAITKYDRFGTLEDSISYCSVCLADIVRHEANKYVKEYCTVCNSALEADLTDLDISLEDGVIWFKCPNSENDSEEHTEIGEYLVRINE